jgi:hypothetical protein
MSGAGSPLVARVLLRTGALPGVCLFRQNTGMAWMGDAKLVGPERVVIENAHPVRFGLCTGSPDIVGWRSIEITPDMVGRRVAVFVGLEAKSGTGRATKDQRRFLEILNAAGGIASVVRAPDDAVALLGSGPTK